MTPHIFPFSIAYADTDAGGIVYHGRYIEIAERARMKWMRGAVPAGDDIGFVIKSLAIDYIRPLRLGDDFVVESRMTKLGAASLNVEQKFVKDGDVYAILTASVAYIGANLRPKRIPAEMLEILEQ
ncbi:MAG: thioesterase family protein [Alphaproteobacteria bacterium]|nr:thioesterase family protein [Alphaproteobacteria bacterium]MDE6570711.1 thioesterase family protein [Alphaproteobacteria bacterium]